MWNITLTTTTLQHDHNAGKYAYGEVPTLSHLKPTEMAYRDAPSPNG
jgi:hypothetical protein